MKTFNLFGIGETVYYIDSKHRICSATVKSITINKNDVTYKLLFDNTFEVITVEVFATQKDAVRFLIEKITVDMENYVKISTNNINKLKEEYND